MFQTDYPVVCNANDYDLELYPLFVILDVYGSLYWAPSFNDIYDNYLELYPKFSPGETVITVLPEFSWPRGIGTAYGLFWYGALTDPEITDIFGISGMFEFGWETD
ncbi:hypothetical protein K8T06_00765 [bacterium]|nr:hypothetical protein [bacterium]